MKCVILAGGKGTRLSEETHLLPKPMIEIGGRPIIWHIMKHYSSFGIKDFITKGLKEALIPRISRIAAHSATKEKVALEEMELIRAGLYGKKKRKLEKGTTMRFALKESGGDVAMVMESSGVETTFKSDVLAKALLDVYVGDDPVSVGAKKAFEAGFYEYINTHT